MLPESSFLRTLVAGLSGFYFLNVFQVLSSLGVSSSITTDLLCCLSTANCWLGLHPPISLIQKTHRLVSVFHHLQERLPF